MTARLWQLVGMICLVLLFARGLPTSRVKNLEFVARPLFPAAQAMKWS
jgi:hypothetical protein